MERDRRDPTRALSRSECQQHLRKAYEYLRSAQEASAAGSVDACAGNSILAAITAADAVAGVLIALVTSAL